MNDTINTETEEILESDAVDVTESTEIESNDDGNCDSEPITEVDIENTVEYEESTEPVEEPENQEDEESSSAEVENKFDPFLQSLYIKDEDIPKEVIGILYAESDEPSITRTQESLGSIIDKINAHNDGILNYKALVMIQTLTNLLLENGYFDRKTYNRKINETAKLMEDVPIPYIEGHEIYLNALKEVAPDCKDLMEKYNIDYPLFDEEVEEVAEAEEPTEDTAAEECECSEEPVLNDTEETTTEAADE